MSGLRERSRARELMDTERVDLATFEACLKDLERINRWTGAYRITLGWLERLRRVHGLRRLVLVDVGSGYGDMLRRIAAWGEAQGVDLDLIGVDLNPHATAIAAQAASHGARHPVSHGRCIRAGAGAASRRRDQLAVRPPSR